MTEHQGTNQLLLCILVFQGINHHRIGGTDTLVTTATVTHHRNHGSTHSGITGRSGAGKDMREDVVAEDTTAQRTIHRLTQTVAIVALYRFLGSLHIIFLGLEDEANLIERSGGCEFVNQAEIQLDIVILHISRSSITLVENHLTIALNIHKVGMRTGNDSCSSAVAGIADYLNIEFIYIALFQLDVDVSILDILLAQLQGIRSKILENLEFILRLSDEGTERNCDRQTDHTGSWNTHTHRILEHIRTQAYLDALRTLTQSGSSLSCTESHSHRFGTADGRHNFLVDERNDALPLIFL